MVASSAGRPGRLAVADGLDPAAVLELLDDLRRHRDAADVFDVAARHRLAVGNDGQRLHHGARILGRLLGVETVEDTRASRGGSGSASRVASATSSTPRPSHSARQLVEQRAQRVGAELVGEQRAHVAQRQRLARADQRGLEDALRILCVHGLVEIVLGRVAGWRTIGRRRLLRAGPQMRRVMAARSAGRG